MRRAVFLSSALLFCVQAPGLAGGELTFREALHLASEKSPAAIMADLRVRQTFERIGQARAFLFPHAEGEVAQNRQTRNLSSFGIPAVSSASGLTPAFNVVDARVKLTQTLFDAAAFRRLESVAIGRELSSAEARKAKADAMALVGTLYIEAKRAEESLHLSEAALRLEVRRYRLAKSRLGLGSGSELEFRDAKSSLSAARYVRRAAQTKTISSRLDLRAALGWEKDEPMVLTDEISQARVVLPKPGEMAEAAKNNPDVEAAARQAKLLQSDEKARWAEFLPKVSAAADYGPNGSAWNGTENTYFFGFQITMPFFDGFERWAAASEAKSRAHEARVAAADTERKKRNAAVEARDLVKDARVLLMARQDKLIRSVLQKRIAETRVSDGAGSLLDALSAEVEAVRVMDDRQEAVAFYRTAVINLAHELGHMEKLLEKESVA